MGEHDVAQFLIGHVLVAGEVDPTHFHLAVLVHAEVHIHLTRAIAAQLVVNIRHVEAALQVEFADLLHVLLDLGQVEDLLLLDVEHLVDLGKSNLVVARHVDLANGGLLLEHIGHHHAARGVGALYLNVLEVAHLPDGAHVFLQNVLVQRRAGRGVQVDPDGVVLDLAVAPELQAHHLQTGDLDRGLRLGLRLDRQRRRSQALRARRLPRLVILGMRKTGREHRHDGY